MTRPIEQRHVTKAADILGHDMSMSNGRFFELRDAIARALADESETEARPIQQPVWTRVTDARPADGQEILALNAEGEIRSGVYDRATGDALFRDGFWHLNQSQATHWAPLGAGAAPVSPWTPQLGNRVLYTPGVPPNPNQIISPGCRGTVVRTLLLSDVDWDDGYSGSHETSVLAPLPAPPATSDGKTD